MINQSNPTQDDLDTFLEELFSGQLVAEIEASHQKARLHLQSAALNLQAILEKLQDRHSEPDFSELELTY